MLDSTLWNMKFSYLKTQYSSAFPLGFLSAVVLLGGRPRLQHQTHTQAHE